MVILIIGAVITISVTHYIITKSDSNIDRPDELAFNPKWRITQYMYKISNSVGLPHKG